MTQDELRRAVSVNLTHLRRAAGMTQAHLAERINYTDKAVS
jgi:DNA-binding XRE family transcriptional regulator